MEEGYSMCLNRWALDKDIKDELGLLLIISSLCAEKGYCFASNQYLAQLFDISEVSVSRKIKKLEEKNYITIEYTKRGCEIVDRHIRLTNLITDDYQKCKSTINKNVKENNISNNNININIKENTKRKDLGKPTLEDIQSYIRDKNLHVNAKEFFEYFEEGNWIDSKGNKVKNWKQKILTWEKFKFNGVSGKSQQERSSYENVDLNDLYEN